MTVTVGVLALLEAKPEKAAALAALLEQARELALAEQQTVSWYAFQADEVTYGIFDTFEGEGGTSGAPGRRDHQDADEGRPRAAGQGSGHPPGRPARDQVSEATADDVLRDRVALVTGAGRGIGRRLAVGLAEVGAHVALLARSENELGEAVAEIRADGGIATAVVTDVQDTDRLRVGVERVHAELGPPVVLINNAAVVAPLGPTAALDPMAVAAAVAVNIVAPITLSSMLIPGMIAAGWGRIVNVSSGIAASPASTTGMNIYAASKAALEAHTLNLAAGLDGSGVTANVYRPGAVDTAMQQWIRDQPADGIGAALHDRFAAMHAEGNLITPEQSARSLLDRIASSQTGRIWSVDDPPR